jgi:carbonic anhydrase
MVKNGTMEFVSDYREVVAGLKRSQQLYRYSGSLTTPPVRIQLLHNASDISRLHLML